MLLAVEEVCSGPPAVCSGPPAFRIRLVPEGRNVDPAHLGAFEDLRELEPLSLLVPIQGLENYWSLHSAFIGP